MPLQLVPKTNKWKFRNILQNRFGTSTFLCRREKITVNGEISFLSKFNGHYCISRIPNAEGLQQGQNLMEITIARNIAIHGYPISIIKDR
jgi:hypothetical protein